MSAPLPTQPPPDPMLIHMAALCHSAPCRAPVLHLTQIDGAAIMMHLLCVAKWNIYYSEPERASQQTRNSQGDDGNDVDVMMFSHTLWKDGRNNCRLLCFGNFRSWRFSLVYWSILVQPEPPFWPLPLPSGHVIASLASTFKSKLCLFIWVSIPAEISWLEEIFYPAGG